MNIKMSIVIFILLSFFNIGAISSDIVSAQNSFNTLEMKVKDISEFQENGVKLQYRTKNNIANEAYRIKESLPRNMALSYKDGGNDEFEAFNSDFNIDIKIWREDVYSYVEIILTNKNPKYGTKYLKNILKNIENSKLENMQYFLYYEGKEKGLDSDYFTNGLVSEYNIRKAQLMKISNGYSGTGYLNDGEKINFALVDYDTGSHIIIGTPIIFTTY
ncbi:hypothetical protein [Clostridium beijerinckii]|uniref:TATA-box binding n=1 Tax=Clostridium beijerinckii TaxID=1520 RepID=A0A9Q5CMX4_CLOBE|nr:hypothetical protein [Clostridium beijerinckii]AQS03056.1 hypothetical protein CLBIJ_04540 [Clostridium beijerinckii]MBA2886510.1 hypothetical protein [Clostridium beijerinckii]MBA2901401.1 hypothetical protein [Clostridium beijerinckii]MBA2911070.1 hypothetical protein [Clostridium beijerinckii]MBA9017411.1 hypothetical protein [Clostridium beijerinckii]